MEITSYSSWGSYVVTGPWGLGRKGRACPEHASTFYSIVEVLDCIGRCQAAIAKVLVVTHSLRVEREGLRENV